jgi:hypothetical protein
MSFNPDPYRENRIQWGKDAVNSGSLLRVILVAIGVALTIVLPVLGIWLGYYLASLQNK